MQIHSRIWSRSAVRHRRALLSCWAVGYGLPARRVPRCSGADRRLSPGADQTTPKMTLSERRLATEIRGEAEAAGGLRGGGSSDLLGRDGSEQRDWLSRLGRYLHNPASRRDIGCEYLDGIQVQLDSDEYVILVATIKEAAQPELIRGVGVDERIEREHDAHQHQCEPATIVHLSPLPTSVDNRCQEQSHGRLGSQGSGTISG